jgi:hypothetical protein
MKTPPDSEPFNGTQVCPWNPADGSTHGGGLDLIGDQKRSVDQLVVGGQISSVTIGRHAGVQTLGMTNPNDCEIDLRVAPTMSLSVSVVGGETGAAACDTAKRAAQFAEARLP